MISCRHLKKDISDTEDFAYRAVSMLFLSMGPHLVIPPTIITKLMTLLALSGNLAEGGFESHATGPMRKNLISELSYQRKSIGQSIDQSLKRQSDRSINRPINQSINEQSIRYKAIGQSASPQIYIIPKLHHSPLWFTFLLEQSIFFSRKINS